MEVAELLGRARKHGASVADCAEVVQLHGTNILRFLRILDLPFELKHLVEWGSGKGFVGFSAAVETTKLRNSEDQRALAAAILSSNLNSKEVRQVTQLRQRSERSIENCVREVLDMRPKVTKRYVYIGSVVNETMNDLQKLSQSVRDSILAAGIEKIGLQGATGRLGDKFFTLVGGEQFNGSMRRIGKEMLEARIRTYISLALKEASKRG